jgi:hypothetical protein
MGVYMMDGPELEVERWEDMRAGVPEPVLVPKPHPSVRVLGGGWRLLCQEWRVQLVVCSMQGSGASAGAQPSPLGKGVGWREEVAVSRVEGAALSV